MVEDWKTIKTSDQMNALLQAWKLTNRCIKWWSIFLVCLLFIAAVAMMFGALTLEVNLDLVIVIVDIVVIVDIIIGFIVIGVAFIAFIAFVVVIVGVAVINFAMVFAVGANDIKQFHKVEVIRSTRQRVSNHNSDKK